MRTIIAGSRGVTNYECVLYAVFLSPITITQIISGTARGADRLGEQYAIENNIELAQFPADWELYGRKAGFLRNKEMANNADALIALWMGGSKGTKHMIDIATKKGLEVFVYNFK